MKSFKQFTYNDRLRLEVLVKAKHTPKEIAEILGMKENTVKSRIHRGKEQLRESLQEEKTPVQEVRRSAAGRPVRVDFAVCHKSRWAE